MKSEVGFFQVEEVLIPKKYFREFLWQPIALLTLLTEIK